MEFGQLQAFVAVVREGSFTRAASRLSLTQPSLSSRIRQLERNLHGDLFLRQHRPVRLTELGEAFLPYAERTLGILEAAGEAMEAARLGLSGRVTLAAPFSLGTYLLPGVVDRFSKSYPLAELDIETGHSEYVASRVLDEVVNLGFSAAFPNVLAQTQVLLYLYDKMTIAVDQKHPLAGLQNVPLQALWSNRLLLIHWGAAFDAYVESLWQMSADPGPIIRIPLAVALPMARQANTITFMPRRLAIASGLAEVHVPDIPFEWNVVLMTRPGRVLTPLEQAFVDIVDIVWQSSLPLAASG